MKIEKEEVVANDSFPFCLYISVTSYFPRSGVKNDLR